MFGQLLSCVGSFEALASQAQVYKKQNPLIQNLEYISKIWVTSHVSAPAKDIRCEKMISFDWLIIMICPCDDDIGLVLHFILYFIFMDERRWK
jgi:hypothetical protein